MEDYIFDYYTNNRPSKDNKHKSLDHYHYKEVNYKDIKKARYVVTPDGEIYDCVKSKWVNQRINKPKGRYKGLANVTLMNEDGKMWVYSVAQITLASWVGPPPEDMEEPSVDHIDSDSLNNSYTNLRWIEKRVNASIRRSRGVGEENSRAILTENDVIHICNMFVRGEKDFDKIASEYGVHSKTIDSIYRRQNWTHLTRYYEW